MPFPFEVPFEEVQANLDTYIETVFAALQSEFLQMPKGQGFVEYDVFERGYEALKLATANFRNLGPDVIAEAVFNVPIALIVLRSMLGFTPPEWAYIATQRSGVVVPQGARARLTEGSVSIPWRHCGQAAESDGIAFSHLSPRRRASHAGRSRGRSWSAPPLAQSRYDARPWQLTTTCRPWRSLPDVAVRAISWSSICRSPRFCK